MSTTFGTLALDDNVFTSDLLGAAAYDAIVDMRISHTGGLLYMFYRSAYLISSDKTASTLVQCSNAQVHSFV